MRRLTTAVVAAIGIAGCGGGGGGRAFVEPAGDVAAVQADVGLGTDDLVVVDNTGLDVRSVIGAPTNPTFNIEFGATVWNPARTRLAFVGDPITEGSSHLLVVDPAVGTPVDLTPAAPSFSSIIDVQWSSDGAFVSFLGDLGVANRLDLFVAPATGGPAIAVNQGAAPADASRDVATFRWKPGSHRLAYVGPMDVANQFDLYFVDADGSNHVAAARAGAAGADVASLEWAPSGNRVAFRSGLVNAGPRFLFTVQDDGTGLVPVGSQPVGKQVERFAWDASSATRLAFTLRGTGPTDVADLFRGDAATGTTVLVGPVGLPGSVSSNDFAFAQGGALVFSLRRPDVHRDLRVAPLVGPSYALQDFLPDPNLNGVIGFTVSPDGARVAYIFEADPLRDSQDLFVVDVSGANDHRVNDLYPLLPDGGFVELYEWSPDSSRIAYSQATYPDTPDDVLIANPAGGAPIQVSIETGDVELLAWTSNSAFVIWEQDALPDPIHLFLATADGATTRLLSTGLPGSASSVEPR